MSQIKFDPVHGMAKWLQAIADMVHCDVKVLADAIDPHATSLTSRYTKLAMHMLDCNRSSPLATALHWAAV